MLQLKKKTAAKFIDDEAVNVDAPEEDENDGDDDDGGDTDAVDDDGGDDDDDDDVDDTPHPPKLSKKLKPTKSVPELPSDVPDDDDSSTDDEDEVLPCTCCETPLQKGINQKQHQLSAWCTLCKLPYMSGSNIGRILANIKMFMPDKFQVCKGGRFPDCKEHDYPMRLLEFRDKNDAAESLKDPEGRNKKQLDQSLFFGCGLPQTLGKRCKQIISADAVGAKGKEKVNLFIRLTEAKKQAVRAEIRKASHEFKNQLQILYATMKLQNKNKRATKGKAKAKKSG